MASTGKFMGRDKGENQPSAEYLEHSSSRDIGGLSNLGDEGGGWERQNARDRVESGVGDTTYSGTSYEGVSGGTSTFSGSDAASTQGNPVGNPNLSSIPGGRSRNEDEGWQYMREGVSEITGKAQKAVTELAHRAQDKVSALAGGARDLATTTGDNVSTVVRRYPWQTLFAGFAVGCFIGLLIPKR